MSLPKPYYEKNGITIYHADCRDILPHLPKVDLVLTDPPYGVRYDGGSINIRKRERLANDDNASIYAITVPLIRDVLLPGGSAYIFYATSCSHEVYPAIASAFSLKYQQLVWYKTNATFAAPFARYHFDFEPFVYCRKGGAAPQWYGGTKERAVWAMPRDPENNWHPTQKPIELCARMICNSSSPGNTVLDPFMGSGSTLVAAKQLNRRAIGIEIEERYCEMAVKRLAQEVLGI